MVVKDYIDEFDPNYYMNKYPDIKNAYGTNSCDLFTHFQNYGLNEGRFLNLDVEKQSQLNNPSFSQNYMQFNDYRINNNSNNIKIETKDYDDSNDCVQHCNDLEDCNGFTRNKKECHFYSGAIYPNDGLDYKKNRSAYVREKVNNTVCDAECKKEKKLKTLEEKYQQSLYNYKEAPDRLKKAKKKYIILKNGETYYEELYKKELSKHINSTIKDILVENKEKLENVKNSSSDFKQKYKLYKNHLNNYLNDIDKNNKVFEKNLYDAITDKELDARKSYYENKEVENIIWYSRVFTVLFYIIFVIYLIVFVLNAAFKVPLNIAFLVFIFFFPLIWTRVFLKYILLITNYLYKQLPRNVYYDI